MIDAAVTTLDRMAAVFEFGGECVITIRVKKEGPTYFTVWATATVSRENPQPYGRLKDGSDTAGLLALWAEGAARLMSEKLGGPAIDEDGEAKAYGSLTLRAPVTSPADAARLMGEYIASFAAMLPKP